MKEVSRLVGSEDRSDFCEALVNFATKWMDFVVGKCEKGRGRRPRYYCTWFLNSTGFYYRFLGGRLRDSNSSFSLAKAI